MTLILPFFVADNPKKALVLEEYKRNIRKRLVLEAAMHGYEAVPDSFRVNSKPRLPHDFEDHYEGSIEVRRATVAS